MPVTPWQRPNFVQERLPGSSAWTNPAGALGDGTVTTVPLNTNLSTQLLLQDFRFNIPADATIDGIEVQITRKVVGGAVEKSVRAMSSGDISPAQVTRSDDLHMFDVVHSSNNFYDISGFASQGSVVLGSTHHASGSAPPILRSPDYGVTWTEIVSGAPANADLWSIAFAPNGTAIAPVYGSLTNYNVCRSTDFGATWTLVDTGITSPAFPSKIATNGSGTWVFGDSSGRIFYSTNDGVTWSLASFTFSTTGGFSDWTKGCFFDGVKFVISADASRTGTTPNGAQIANSTDGVNWTLRYQDPAGGQMSYMSLANGILFMSDEGYTTGFAGKYIYSTDHGDTWTTATVPALPSVPGTTLSYAGSYLTYNPIRNSYLWSGGSLYAGNWSVVLEAPNFPPTSFTWFADTDAPHHGEWVWPTTVVATFNDRYGVRHESVKLLVGGTGSFTPADAIYGEGTTIPGGTFAYRETFLSIGGAEDDLHNTSAKTYGGAARLGSDPNASSGAQAWLPAEVKAPSFGIGYQAEGTQGTLQLNDVRVRVYYTLGTRFWDKFVMSYEQ
jgi:photosystem II stability/assembly factor-like uncharacterized protein